MMQLAAVTVEVYMLVVFFCAFIHMMRVFALLTILREVITDGEPTLSCYTVKKYL